MTSYTVVKLADLPVVLVTLLEDWESSRDVPMALDEVIEILDSSNKQLYYVSDLTRSPRWGLNDVIAVANLVSRGRAIVKHPNVKGVIAITTDKLIDLAAKGMNSEVFGKVSVAVFQTLEEALAHVRSQL